jgi:hypothetical protein
MSRTTRRLFALLSAFGFVTSIFFYIASFIGSLAETLLPWTLLLFLGFNGLFLPLFILESPESRRPLFFVGGFARSLPSWVAPCARVLGLAFLAHVTWRATHFGQGSATIQDGQYVLSAHGRVLEQLSFTEYLTVKGETLRLFTTALAFLYFVPMTYWWFSAHRLLDPVGEREG